MNSFESAASGLARMPQSPLEIKVFVFPDALAAEKTIALWLKQHPVQVKHVAQSQSEKGGSFVFTVSLFYSRYQD